MHNGAFTNVVANWCNFNFYTCNLYHVVMRNCKGPAQLVPYCDQSVHLSVHLISLVRNTCIFSLSLSKCSWMVCLVTLKQVSRSEVKVKENLFAES